MSINISAYVFVKPEQVLKVFASDCEVTAIFIFRDFL